MSKTRINSSAFGLALLSFTLLSAYACNSVQFTPGATDASGSLVYNGVTYSTSIDESGNLVITTTDGAAFKIDPSGKVIESTSPGGARINITYQGNNLDISSFFPEFENSSRAKTLRIAGEYAAQSAQTVCDAISERCDELDYYVNTILPSIHDDLVGFWSGQLGGTISNDVINQVVAEHLQQLRDRSINFCSGWQLALLLNQNPCDPEAGQPCDSPAGGGWLVSENDGALEDPFEMQINGTSATATLTRIRRFTDSTEVVELPLTMTGTLSQGSGGCVRCTVFQGTWTAQFDEGLDGLEASLNPTYVPPQRTFTIVFAKDNRSFTGNLIDESNRRLAGQRSGCP